MSKLARWHVILGLIYGLAGLLLGVYMAISSNPQLVVVHAHYLLIGLTLSCLYGLLFAQFQYTGSTKTPAAQFYFHHVGTTVTALGSPLFYGGYGPLHVVGPILGVAALLVVIGLLLMLAIAVQGHFD